MFSTSARSIKELKWKLNGTTQNVDWVKAALHEAVDQVPGLAEKMRIFISLIPKWKCQVR